MKIFNLKGILILSVIGMLSLLGFQGIWIFDLVQDSREKMNLDLKETLCNVISKLESIETIDISDNSFQSGLLWVNNKKSDSIDIYKNVLEKSSIQKSQFFSDSSTFQESPLFYSLKGKTFNQKEFNLELPSFAPNKNTSNFSEHKVFNKNYDVLPSSLSYDKIVSKFMSIAKYYEEIGNGQIPLFKRLNYDVLDSLLNYEISLYYGSKNVDYEYAVKDIVQDDFLAIKGSSDLEDFKNTPIKAELFPNDLNTSAGMLHLIIKDKGKFLISRIWPLLSISLIVLTLLLVVLGSSLYFILKQKQLSDIKNDFINNMTHEFKTPIATISLATEALQDNDMQLKPKILERYINVIKDENKRLSQQVEKVLQMATLDKKKYNLNISTINIHQIIKNAVDYISLQVQQKNGSIQVQLNAKRVLLNADELHISNIVRNLLENAYKYSPFNPKIMVETNDDPEGVSISIKDNGIGLDKESIRRIFDKFYRVSTGNIHDIKGFGLGLTYVKTMIEAHNGTVTVNSQPQKGSEFQIILPYNYEEK